MKKIFILFLIFGLSLSQLFGMSVENDLAASAQMLKQKVEEIKNQTSLQAFTSRMSELSEKFSDVPGKVNATFNWVADHLDTILTKKGAIKTLLILGPLFATYCYFFPPAPVQFLINRIVSSTTQGSADIAKAALEGLKNNKAELKALVIEVMQEVGDIQATIRINQEIGEIQAFWNSMYVHPFYTGLLGAYRIAMTGITVGIPFVLGLWTQNKFKPIVPTSSGIQSIPTK